MQESAGAIVRFCDVHDGREHGIYIGMQGWASVDKCHIFGCNTGVWVGHLGSQCSLRGSDLRACSQVGLIVHTQAAALLEANNITAKPAQARPHVREQLGSDEGSPRGRPTDDEHR